MKVIVRKTLGFAVIAGLVLISQVAMAIPGSVSVGFAGTHSSRGTFVDVTAATPLNVTGFGMNIVVGVSPTISVYRKVGATTLADVNNAAAWTLHQTVPVVGNGFGTATNVPITPVAVAQGQTIAFALVASSDGLIGNGDGEGVTSAASDANISIFGAFEMHDFFGDEGATYQGWPFQGTVSYDTTGVAAIPTLSQWGLIGMSLLLAAAGALRMRQVG